MPANESDLRYPIGKFEAKPYSAALKAEWIRDIKFMPDDLEFAVQNMDEAQLDTPYREGGWTVKQLVHHMADSHMNAYIRFKWCLTEDMPTIKTYHEKEWANLPDVLVFLLMYLLHCFMRCTAGGWLCLKLYLKTNGKLKKYFILKSR